MPKRMGAEMRELVMVEDRSQLQLERNVWSSTGFKHVIKVGQKFQARLQVPGDGQGGSKTSSIPFEHCCPILDMF